ncbi:MAG: glycosyltransferase [Candidatus Dormibacteraeota bacterium]|nr:glycosyltransferase [Candidatus Dormibacteraeota bacterium]
MTTVIPTYRRPRLLRRAVESALNQTRPDGIVAVYDDASGDETDSVMREFSDASSRVTYHRQPTNLGLVENFRFALEHVDTPYFSILSNDDMLLPRMYEAALGALESHPEAAFASTQVIHADDRWRVIKLGFPWHPGVYAPPDGLLRLIEWGAPAWAGIIFRSSVLAELGNLDPTAGTLIDYDFQIRIAARKTYVVDPAPGAVFFHRRDSISGEARLDGTWPAWQHMTKNLVEDESVAPEVRNAAGVMLEEQLITRLYGIGILSSRHGNLSDAMEAAEMLSTRGQDAKARMIHRLVSAFGRLPSLRRVHGKLSEWRQPFERTGWRRRPVTLASYLEELQASGETGAWEDRPVSERAHTQLT